MRPRHLSHTLNLMVVVITIVCGVIISQAIVYRYSQKLFMVAISQAHNIAHQLALDAADKVLINDVVALHKLLEEQIFISPDVAYLFITHNGQVLAHTFKGGIPEQLIDANTIDNLKTGHIERFITDANKRIIDVAWPIFEGKAGILRVGYSEASLRYQIKDIWFQLSLLSFAVMVAALVLSYIFIRWLTTPLRLLTNAAESFQQDNLDIQMDQVEGPAEVKILATAFNRMLQRLKTLISQLTDSNQRLEQKNQELNRAHNQLKAFFAVTQEIAVLPDLRSIGQYFIEKFRQLVKCSEMVIIIKNMPAKEWFICSRKHITRCEENSSEQISNRMLKCRPWGFIPVTDICQAFQLDFPKNIQRIAAFPLNDNGQLLGALLAGCPDRCQCAKNELEIIPQLLNQASGAIKRAVLQENEYRDLKTRVEKLSGFGEIIGRDPKMQTVYQIIEDVSLSDSTVLIQGESGTGKELVARAIHEQSARKHHPFMVINCAAYPSTLLESELFGHEKGAFTGATNRQAGRFELAHKGTVFLDEIGEISPTAEIKLLRVLQTRKFERIGGSGKPVALDVRILAATHQNLRQLVQEGNFREDLYYRLNVIPIILPPLRERKNDIPLLVNYFLKRFVSEQNKTIQNIHPEAMRYLLDCQWPGNVRELENSIEHAVVLAKEDMIYPRDIPSSLQDNNNFSKMISDKKLRSIYDNEATFIRQVLEECDWNKTNAAVQLGISRSTLYEKLKRYHIQISARS